MALQHYYHSVRLDMDKCKGCTTCLKRCPTEAIRIRNNRASILNERCIDCGECIKVCANHAKVAVTDPLESIKRFKYPIALPAPTLYAQFQGVHQPEPIIASLFRLGFVDVFEVARAAEIVSYAISRAMREEDRPKPVISSACPAILRLIQEHPISRQEVLLEHLREEGFAVTQATISRDIRELCLVKAATSDGYRYVSSHNESLNPKMQGRFETIFHESVLGVDYAGHVVLVKCYSGMANAACEVFDALKWKNVVGTLSGDDTFLIVARSERDAKTICNELTHHIGQH